MTGGATVYFGGPIRITLHQPQPNMYIAGPLAGGARFFPRGARPHWRRRCADTRNLEETCRVFRTAYAVAKMDLAFTAHRGLLELQEANGLDIGKVHRSDHSCSKITNHIANQMKTTFCERLKKLSPHIAIMLDESTLFKKSVIALYLRARLSDVSEMPDDILKNGYGVAWSRRRAIPSR